jgi:hypothetical protein
VAHSEFGESKHNKLNTRFVLIALASDSSQLRNIVGHVSVQHFASTRLRRASITS